MVLRISKFLGRLLVLLLAVAVVGLGALAWRLSSGPVSVAWLNPYIERALSGEHAVIAIEDAQVHLGEDRLLELSAIGVRIKAPDGRLLGELPEVEVGLSTRALLFEGAVAVRRIEATAPSVMLIRREDGSIGFDDEGAPADAPGLDLRLLFAEFLRSTETDARRRYLEEVRISGGEVALQDRALGRTVHAKDAELLVRIEAGASAKLTFTIAQAKQPATVAVSALRREGQDRIGIDVEVAGLFPPEYADLAPDLPLAGLRLPLRGKARGALGLDGERLPIRFDLAAQPGTIELPGLGLEPVPVDALEVGGTVAADLEAVAIDRLRYRSGGAELTGRGEVAWRGGEPTLEADLEAANVSVRDIQRYWPPREGNDARKWVVDNLTAGLVPKARAKLRFGPGELGLEPLPDHTLDGEFAFEDVTVRYLDTMPPLVGAKGSATFTGQTMSFEVVEGHVDDLAVERGSIVITGIGIKGRDATQLEIAARASGPVAQALALVDQPPLEYAREVGISPEAVGGRVTADLRIGAPLHRDLEPSEVRVAAEATITDGSLAGPPLSISDAQLRLTIDREGLDAVGDAIVEQVPLELELRENFGQAAFERRYRIAGVPELAMLRGLGLELPVGADGSVGVDATITELPGRREAELALDLAPLAIEAPLIGWRKPAGEPGTLDAFVVIQSEGAIEVPRFLLASGSLRAEGSLEAQAAPWRIERAQLDRLRLGESEGSLRLRRDPEAGYRIEIDAGTLDLAPLLAESDGVGEGSTGAAPAKPLRLNLRAGRLLLDGGTLREVQAQLVRDAEGWRQADGTAQLSGGGEANLSLVPEGDKRTLRITSTNAGDLLRALDQTSRVEGGELRVEATIFEQIPSLHAEGVVEGRNFRVLDAPVLARLLTLASPRGISDLLGGQGLSLERIEAPFAVRGRELRLDRGRMYGSQLGLTFQGRVDLEARTLDIDGTVVPLYGINWTIGQIPLIGQFLRGAEGEGAFAATYAIRGPLNEPSVSVNPLAALAPGFLRDLFTGLQEGTLEPPEMPPSHDR